MDDGLLVEAVKRVIQLVAEMLPVAVVEMRSVVAFLIVALSNAK